MKKNNQGSKNSKPKVSGKAKWLALLLFLQTVLANAIEGVVLRTISSPMESRVILDTSNDGQADTYVSIPLNVESLRELYTYIRTFFEPGSIVEIDDDYMFHDGNMPFAYLGGVLTIDGLSPIIIMGWGGEIFEAANAKATRELNERWRQQQEQRTGR